MHFFFVLLWAFAAQAQTFDQSLSDKGLSKGIVSETSHNRATVYFALPPRGMVEGAELRLKLEHSPLLIAPSNLKVLLEGMPVYHSSLAGNEESAMVRRELTIPINTNVLKGSFVRVDFDFVNILSADPCLDQRLGRGLVRIAEDSAFRLKLSRGPETVSEFFQTLPDPLLVNVNKENSKEALAQLFRLDAVAEHFGSQVLLTTDSAAADVMIGAGETIGLEKSEGKMQLNLPANSAFTAAPFLEKMEGLFSAATLPRLTLSQTGSRNTLVRDELGLSPEGEAVSLGRRWSLNLPRLPGTNLVPSKLHLSVAGTRTFGKNPAGLYIYLGENLLQIVSLSDSELPQYHQILLPERVSEWPAVLRMELRRNDLVGKCGADYDQRFDLRILEDTSVEYRSREDRTADFIAFTKSDSDYDVVVPKKNPLAWFSTISWLRRSFALNVDRAKFTDTAGSSSRAIVLKEHEGPGPAEIQFLATQKLTVERLTGLTRISSSMQKDAHTLEVISWGAPSSVKAQAFSPDHHDLLVLGPDRVEVLSTTSEWKDRVGVLAQKPGLLSFFEEYRYLLLGVAWVILTLVFLLLGKKFR